MIARVNWYAPRMRLSTCLVYASSAAPLATVSASISHWYGVRTGMSGSGERERGSYVKVHVVLCNKT